MYAEVFRLHAKLLQALASSKRLEIVHLLRDQELTVSQIQDMLGLPQANLSQHLMVLRSEGIVKCRKSGKQMHYSLAHKNFIQASDLIRSVLIKRHKGKEAQVLKREMKDLVPLVSDPICGMRLSPKTASYALAHRGKKYYFCAQGCLRKFKTKKKVKEI